MKTQLKIIYTLMGIGVFLPFIIMEIRDTSTQLLLMWVSVAILSAVIVVAWTDSEYRSRLKRYFWLPLGADLLLYGVGRLLMLDN